MKLWQLGAACSCAMLAACGGSGDDTNPITNTPDARVSVVAQGAIDGFGSVIVNGVRYDTTGSTFSIDGTAGTEAGLRVGHVVIVRGSMAADGSDARASSVDFDDLVEGPIAAIDLAAGTLTVLEQLVRIGDETSFDDDITPASLEGLAVGDVVEVSGFRESDGSIAATRIEREAPGGEFEVTGMVSGLSGTTFSIHGLSVDFSAAQLEDFPSGAPEDGQLVEVKGSTFGPVGELVARVVEFKGDEMAGADGTHGEIEGFITRFVSATDFDVAGVPVTTDGGTVFENGTAADLALNRKVEVEGRFNADGVLVADEVEFKQGGFIRIEGLVDSVDGDDLTMFGITVRTSLDTRFEDNSEADLERFGIGDIAAGDYLELRGYEEGGVVVALLIEREEFDGEVALRGFVEALSDPDFTILGVTIQTGANTVFRGSNDQIITSGEFFFTAEGRLVEAEGRPNGNIIIANEVEFED